MSSLKDKMILYHGSYAKVENIDLSECKEGKDFGRGFYLTDNIDQAKSFIKNSLIKAKKLKLIPKEQNYGYVSTFEYHINAKLKVYEFKDVGKEWLWFIAMNRRGELADEFRKTINTNIILANVVIGKIANDTTNPTIMAYLNGLYGDIYSDKAIDFAISNLMPERLKNQFCFLTEDAISTLEFKEANKYE